MTSTESLVAEEHIQKIKYLIESRQFMRALTMINILQPTYPSSAYILALKALVYKNTLPEKALSVCKESQRNFHTDKLVLPEVLSTLQTVLHYLGEYDLATSYYKSACNISNNLDLMKGHFYCYHHESSFVDQLKISLEMYNFHERRMFLFWSVFSIQLKVCDLLLREFVTSHEMDKPETFLVYFSVPEHHGNMDLDPARDILAKLGPTLLVAEVGNQCVEGVRLSAHLSDYTAAAEVLSQHLKSCPDWRLIVRCFCKFLEEIDHSFGDTFFCPMLVACKISQLSEDPLFSNLMSEDLEMGIKRLSGRETELEEAVTEYFNRHVYNAKVCLQVLAKDEELRLIKNLLDSPIVLQEEFNSLIKETHSGLIEPRQKIKCQGTSVALKTKKFIILATDGKLTPGNTFEALTLKADKLKNFADMCVALTGDWKNLSKMLNTLHRCMKFLTDKGKRRPTVSKFADFARKRLFSRVSKTEVIFGAFDQSKDDRSVVPCVFYANDHTSFEIKKQFFCAGTGSKYANAILSKGTVEGRDLDEAEAVSSVEKALAYANICDDGCTGGWANIHVIKDDGTIRTLPREHISSTLRSRHHSYLKMFVDAHS